MLDKYQKEKEERYQRFVFTLSQCGIFIVEATDEIIETYIFEDFDIGVRGDLCDDNLELFMDEGWIDENIRDKCLRLRELFLDIEVNQPEIWNVQSTRTSRIWRVIFELTDEIKTMLYV